MRKNGLLALGFHALFLLFLAAPLIVIVLVSFTAKGYLAMPFDGASLRWYRARAGIRHGLAHQSRFGRHLG